MQLWLAFQSVSFSSVSWFYDGGVGDDDEDCVGGDFEGEAHPPY